MAFCLSHFLRFAEWNRMNWAAVSETTNLASWLCHLTGGPGDVIWSEPVRSFAKRGIPLHRVVGGNEVICGRTSDSLDPPGQRVGTTLAEFFHHGVPLLAFPRSSGIVLQKHGILVWEAFLSTAAQTLAAEFPPPMNSACIPHG